MGQTIREEEEEKKKSWQKHTYIMLLSPPVHPVLKAYYVIKSHIVQEEQTLWLHLLVQRELTFICQTRARSLGHTGAVGWLLLDRELCDTFWHFSLHLHWATSREIQELLSDILKMHAVTFKLWHVFATSNKRVSSFLFVSLDRIRLRAGHQRHRDHWGQRWGR